MSYATLISAAAQVGGALLASKSQRSIASIRAQLGEQQAAAANATADVRNIREQERASTSRMLQSLNNQRRAAQMAARTSAAKGALFRAQEATAANTAQGRLRLAQAAGQAQAEGAFLGITETGAGLVESSLALQEARADELAQRQAEQKQFLLGEQIAASEGEIQLSDMRAIFANVNTNRAVAPGVAAGPGTLETVLGATDWMKVGNAFADVYSKWTAGRQTVPADAQKIPGE